MWLRKWWNRWFVREVLVLVPKGFEVPESPADAGKDPRFLRELSESMRRAPIVYENILAMLRSREAQLRALPPETNEAERLAWKWRTERMTAEAAVLRTLMSAPATAAKALNDMARHKQAAQADHDNWALERTAP
ncbi:MAG: hypothetical protein A3E01_00345 [Gammaproteobacteria bacterium RIFCSPHIGHO2_12_FULL_63_22]|nr:MAG: hypothetical protein A3E01_00345 [Gammaproteobacteria bacterium RIFCSPHIGHO2_12_FULL_63_22]